MVHRFSLTRAIPVLLWLMLASLVTLTAYAQTPAAAPGSPPKRILVLGDSLSAEYGLARGSGWVQLLQNRIDEQAPGQSAMPQDLVKFLTKRELRDLVEYLSTLK